MATVLGLDDLVKEIARKNGILVTGKVYDCPLEISGPNDERVKFQVGKKDPHSFNAVFVRVHDTLYLDDRLKQDVPEGQIHNIIYLANFDTLLGDSFHTMHSALTLAAMDYVDFKDAYVLDLGSGDGVTSLKAKKSGAYHIIAVDDNTTNRGRLKTHIYSNGMDKIHFRFIKEDINSERLLQLIPRELINIVVANIGPSYEDTDLEAIKYLEHMPNTHTFIGAGYGASGFRKDFRPFNPGE